MRAQAPIKWRLQTYSGAPLGAHVIKPQIEAFNGRGKRRDGDRAHYADQLVPTSELFRSLQNGTLDAIQSDEATMASPVDIAVFGGYFPFATRYSLDVASMFMYYGLDEDLAGSLRGRAATSPICRPARGIRCTSSPSASLSVALPT